MITTRVARAEDLPAARDLLIASWRDTYEPIYGRAKVDALTGRWHTLDALRRQLDHGVLRLLLEEDGALAATASAALAGDATLHLHQLYVRPEKMRRGFGSTLLLAVVSAFPEAQRVRLEVESENGGAVAFYRAQGFRQVGETVERDSDGSETTLLILEAAADDLRR